MLNIGRSELVSASILGTSVCIAYTHQTIMAGPRPPDSESVCSRASTHGASLISGCDVGPQSKQRESALISVVIGP